VKIIRQLEEDGGHPICWLNGPAGYGKSAIAQAIVERYATQNRLAASFFFLRGAGSRSSIARVISTIAHQLSVSLPAVKPFIQHVIDSERQITTQSLWYQFRKLVIQPILAVCKPTHPLQNQQPDPHQSRAQRSYGSATAAATAGSSPHLSRSIPVTIIIVIDGLDECDDKDLMGEFIEIILDAFVVNRGLPFRVLITSRVEEYIRKKLEADAALFDGASPVFTRL
jgi:hypothetical protein